MRSFLLFVASLGLLLLDRSGPVGHADEKKGETTIRGEWVLAKVEFKGKEESGELGTYRIDANRIACKLGDTKLDYTYKVDQSSVPHQIDLYSADGKMVPLWRGIFQAERDTLVICFASTEFARPTEFKTDKGGRVMLHTLKRKK